MSAMVSRNIQICRPQNNESKNVNSCLKKGVFWQENVLNLLYMYRNDGCDLGEISN